MLGNEFQASEGVASAICQDNSHSLGFSLDSGFIVLLHLVEGKEKGGIILFFPLQ